MTTKYIKRSGKTRLIQEEYLKSNKNPFRGIKNAILFGLRQKHSQVK